MGNTFKKNQKRMDKNTLMTLGTILKFVIGLGGIVTTLVLLTIGLAKKDKKKLKKAGLVFLGTFVLLLVLGVIEFVILANV